MAVRGVRGATTVVANDPQRIRSATSELLRALLDANAIYPDDIAAAYFTTTTDLDAAFPASAARELGWQQVPLLDAWEIPVPRSLPMCIRVLLLWNTERAQSEVVHVYQRGAACLRPDLATARQEERP